jgi:hypothetical protein
MPVPYLIAFISYAIILLVEKVAFDSHSLIDHDHHGPTSKGSRLSHTDEQEHKAETKKPLLNNIDTIIEEDENEIQQREGHQRRHQTTIGVTTVHNPIGALIEQHLEDFNNDSDLDEETVKDVITSKGRFATYMQNKNLSNNNV